MPFNIGWSELVIIFLIVLLLFGAKRLPEIGRSIGKAITSFKHGLREIENSKEEENQQQPKLE